ncbi:MAG: RidA family protein [Pseudorhodoplanes sp.]
MSKKKEIIGGQLVVNGRAITVSRAVRAGDFVFLTGQVPQKDGMAMTTGTIEDQTRVVIEMIRDTLALAGCTLDDVVKSMVWLRDRSDFAGFNQVYGEYFKKDFPARSAVQCHMLVDVRVELECVAYKPL